MGETSVWSIEDADDIAKDDADFVVVFILDL
jgi:hypothetical protein